MIFVIATIPVDFDCDGRQGEANYLLKRVDDHSGRKLVADGYTKSGSDNFISLKSVLVGGWVYMSF